MPVPSPKSKVRTCGNCDLSLEIPADATPGTKATLGVDVNLSRYPAPASHPVDQRVEKSFLFQVESPKKVEALRLQMAEFTTYELRVNKLKASPPTYASYLNRAIVTGILSLICGLLALARRSSHKPS